MGFQALAGQYQSIHLAKKSSAVFYGRLHRQYFADWVEFPQKKQIRDWHRATSATPAHGNKGLAYLKALFNWAINEELWDQDNPASGIRRHPTFSRERVLTQHEVTLLMNALIDMHWKFRVVLQVLLTTGCRLSEALQMEWVHLDLAKGTWLKPKTKNGRPQLMPLPKQTCLALHAIQTRSRGSYVFDGAYDRHFSRAGAEKTWWDGRKELQLSDVRLHDFRRTVATRLHEQGEPELLIKSVLNHHVEATNVTAVYIRPSFDRIKAALQKHADGLYALVTPCKTQG